MLLLTSFVVGNVVYDKFTIRALRRETSYLLASLLEVSNEKRAATTIRTGEPTEQKTAPPHPTQIPRQIGLGQR